MRNDELKPEGFVDTRDSAGGNGSSPATAAHASGNQRTPGRPDPEPLDLRDMEGRARTGHAGLGAGNKSTRPTEVPGWRFVADGTAIWFSDGYSTRRTIVLPKKLDDIPERGLRRALRATGGMRTWPRRHARTNLDRIRRLTLQLVVMTEYRELLYGAAVAGFERPLLVERGVRLVQGRKDTAEVPNDLSVMDEGSLRVDLDRVTFVGSRNKRTAAARNVMNIQEDIDGGRLSVQPSGDRPWHLLGVSPVAVFAAAAACRITAEQSQRYRSRPAKIAADLLDPNDPTLPVPGDDVVLELEGLCRDMGRGGSW